MNSIQLSRTALNTFYAIILDAALIRFFCDAFLMGIIIQLYLRSTKFSASVLQCSTQWWTHLMYDWRSNCSKAPQPPSSASLMQLSWLPPRHPFDAKERRLVVEFCCIDGFLKILSSCAWFLLRSSSDSKEWVVCELSSKFPLVSSESSFGLPTFLSLTRESTLSSSSIRSFTCI